MKNAFVNTNIIAAYDSGSLDGLSFAVKDNIDVAGEITGYGSPSWASTHSKAISNAVCIDQLLAAGATCLGKTISDELAYSLIGINHFYGTPLNPKTPDRVPGGSSSGSASAVASGIVDFAIGTDTAGSVRVPASNCGIWGYRPSHGLISAAGVEAQAASFDTVGVFANSGQILKKVIQVLLGNPVEKSRFSPSVYFVDDVLELCDSEVKEVMSSIIAKISKINVIKKTTLQAIAGQHVNCNYLFEISAHLISAEIWNTLDSWVEHFKPELSPLVNSNIINYAKSADRSDIQKNICAKVFFAEKLNHYLQAGNLLCFPTTPTLAPKLIDVTPEFVTMGDYYPRTMGITAISGLSRAPQITVPIMECNGVPIGVSFISAYGQDVWLANFCNELQSFIK